MACPFSSRRFKLDRKDESKDGDHRRIPRIKQDERTSKPSRQSSVQITSSLLGEDSDDLEDTQTLNLKHLRAAVTLLTNPLVLNKRRFYFFSFRYNTFAYNTVLTWSLRSLLYHSVQHVLLISLISCRCSSRNLHK